MLIKELLGLYREDPRLLWLQQRLQSPEAHHERLQIKGLVGSLDAVLAAALHQHQPQTTLFVLADRDEAAYFFNDLQHLLGETEVVFFPVSWKKPYEYSEVDNANVLMRSEVLNRLSNPESGPLLVVTYPEALSEKVVSRRTLVQHSFSVAVGERLDTQFLGEFLAEQDFERTDFVYEAGQYALRGGIIDIFSFANEWPYRLDLFGDEVESIRTFDPDTQLSKESVSRIQVLPNLQQKQVLESRESFLSFFPKNTRLWLKDVELTLELMELAFEKVQQQFEQIVARSGGIRVISEPDQLFETRRGFLNALKAFPTLEFGKRFYFKEATDAEGHSSRLLYPARPQPNFNKDFARLIETLHEQQYHGYTNVIVAETTRQLERLSTIVAETDPYVRFAAVHLSLREGFIDEHLKLACFTDHQIFDRFYRYRLREKYSKTKALTLRELKTLQPGDYITHIDYGIGRFAGLVRMEAGGGQQEGIRLIFKDNDTVLINVQSLHKIARYTGKEGVQPSLSKLGSPEWENRKNKVRRQVRDIATELIQLYAKRKLAPGFAFSPDSFLQAELESSFLYEDTPDQAKATADVKEDMQKPHPMDRLVCGDVGFGKTEVAMRAAFKAVADGKQVAVLVPTTVLAMQHYRTFRDRYDAFPIKVEYLNRFKTSQQVRETLKRVAAGETDVLIGTHRIVAKDVTFKNLGLLVVDEEQKFGVKVKDRLKELKLNLDVLTLTATPIPRTLHFSLMGARDLSVIATPPPNRQPVTTELMVFDEIRIRDAVAAELKRSGQVFFIHNRISDLESLGNMLLRLVPDARIGIAHGQMEGDRLEKAMMKFIEGEYDILISTNIVESGLDIPNANTILINHAHLFGLSDLHQMRGRVGRSNKKAYCYLMTPALSLLSSDSRKRLQALEEFSDLGDGFKVAMRDLDIRGAGDLLGAEQSGFVNDLGFDTYHKILDETIQELKQTQFRELFADELNRAAQSLHIDCQVETDFPVRIPENYVSNISERLSLYNRLDILKTADELQRLEAEITDRFGPVPPELQELMRLVQVRWQAEAIGFEKLSIKQNTLKGTFVSATQEAYFQSERFGRVLDAVKDKTRRMALREVKGRLLLQAEGVDSVAAALALLQPLVLETQAAESI